MMCTGTLILNANAQLFNMLTAKNIAAATANFSNGTLVFLTNWPLDPR
jgi:hypothetical protein